MDVLPPRGDEFWSKPARDLAQVLITYGGYDHKELLDRLIKAVTSKGHRVQERHVLEVAQQMRDEAGAKNPCEETAIYRKTPPEPLRWLFERGLIRGRSLDFGCGHGPWYGMEGYDPHWRPAKPTGFYDTIACTYVINVVDEKTQDHILWDIYQLLDPHGTAYIAVRRDLPLAGRKGRGTDCWQRYVILQPPFQSISKTSTREIYTMRRGG